MPRDPVKQAGYKRRHYEKNRARIIAESAAKNKETRQKIRAVIWEYKRNHPCVDCGEKDPIVLDFDHTRDKKFSIVNYTSKGRGLHTVLAEIAKCEVRCANCHKRKTYNQFERNAPAFIDMTEAKKMLEDLL